MKTLSSPQKGVMLLEALIALLVFALGILGLVGAQVTAQSMSLDAKYRAEAAMHADRLVSQMWSGDRSNANLVAQYSTGGDKYDAWLAQVTAAGTGLAGATLTGNEPTVAIDANNNVIITLRWQGPQEKAAHIHTMNATIN